MFDNDNDRVLGGGEKGGVVGVEQINWQNVGTKNKNKDMSAIKSAYKNILLCMRQVNKPGMDKKQEHRAEHTENWQLATGNRAPSSEEAS